MERDFEKEMDRMKKEIAEIKELLKAIVPAKGAPGKAEKTVGHIIKQPNMHPDPNIMNILGSLEDKCGNDGGRGYISYLGVFSSGGRQSTWIRHQVSADELISLIENGMAGKVLACIGNNDRLNILLAILKKPMTVAQLVEECGYHSTGQVYHHLKPLIAADLVIEDSKNEGKGVYAIQPHRVQGIIMLLAGISDMLDPKYTQGRWDYIED